MTNQSIIGKREKILASSLSLFVDKGFHSTPTSAISKAAGVSAGILYHYFESKEELIYTLYLETKMEFLGAIGNKLDRIHSFKGKMRLIWTNAWNYAADNPHKFKFIQQFHNSPFALKIRQDLSIQKMEERLTVVIQEGIDTKVLKNIPIEMHTNNSNYLIISFVELIGKNPELRIDKAFIEQGWECYWDCIKT